MEYVPTTLMNAITNVCNAWDYTHDEQMHQAIAELDSAIDNIMETIDQIQNYLAEATQRELERQNI